MKFNLIEMSIIKEFSLQIAKEKRESFLMYMKLSEVLSREDTGVGFFTHSSSKKLPINWGITTIGGVFAEIQGLKNPMTFCLMLNRGGVDILEGASIDEGTQGLDFNNVVFRVMQSV